MKFETDVAPGIHRIDDGFFNWYLVTDGDRVCVVDAGLPASWTSLRQALQRIGRRPEDIAAVVLTHAHYDHVGFAEKARRRLGVPVLLHERDVDLARHPKRWPYERFPLYYNVRYPRTNVIQGVFVARGMLATAGVEEVTTFTDGETLDVPGRPKVVFTPGHTPGHCALLFEDRDCVIAGDAFVMLDPYTTARGPRPVAKAATADSHAMRASLQRLRDLDGVRTALTGHGPPWRRGLADAAQRALDAPHP